MAWSAAEGTGGGLRVDVAAPGDLASRAVLTRAGFAAVGTARSDGQPELRSVQELTGEEW